jgi:hypothetical protein
VHQRVARLHLPVRLHASLVTPVHHLPATLNLTIAATASAAVGAILLQT